MTERMSLSKSKRFSIFTRDQFTCQYCGQRPPEVILEIDHINPVANGGDNDDLNLITSCYDCNRGKGAKEIVRVIPKPDADLKWLESQQEIAELKRYQESKSEKDAIMAEIAESLVEEWKYAFQRDDASREIDFYKLLKSFTPEIIEKAIYIASDNENLHGNTWSKFKYVCGIAWNLVRREDGE